jgi:NTE family protein
VTSTPDSYLNEVRTSRAAQGDRHRFALSQRIAKLPLFRALDDDAFATLCEEVEWFSLPGGWTLFKEGDVADAAFFALSGRLGAFTTGSDGEESLVGQVSAGEVVGEMALVLGEPRSATVVALRDSELLRLSRATFAQLVDRSFYAQRFLIEILARRLRNTSHRPPFEEAPRTLAIVPLSPHTPTDRLSRDLAAELERLGQKLCLLGPDACFRPSEWFLGVEERNDLVLYQADWGASAWTKLCLRQADRVLLIASSGSREVLDDEAIASMLRAKRAGTVELVVIHRDGSRSAGFAAEVLGRHRVGFHCHLREGRRADVARLARLLTGRAVGVVLSGGGARGFAHIGALRALKEAGIPIDLFAGASMGSIIGALAALEWDEDEIAQRIVPAFVESNPLGDYTVPFVALARGRKLSQRIREHFGDVAVEECWRHFFCTAADLTTGRVRVFRSGPLWRALRASVAIPGVVMPVIENGHVLVDGGVLNNMPIDLLLGMRRGPVIAVNVARQPIWAKTDDLEEQRLWNLMRPKRRGAPHIVEILMRTGSVGSDAQIGAFRSRVDLFIEPPLQDIGMLDWKSYKKAIDGGYRFTAKLIEQHKPALLGT